LVIKYGKDNMSAPVRYMKKEIKNTRWKEHLFAFVASGVLLMFVLLSYNTIVFEKGGSTGSQALRRLFRLIHYKIGKEYIITLILCFMLLTGFLALRAYIKENSNKEK